MTTVIFKKTIKSLFLNQMFTYYIFLRIRRKRSINSSESITPYNCSRYFSKFSVFLGFTGKWSQTI